VVERMNKKTPDIRFKGFSDDWEQRKFLDLVKRISTSSDSKTLPKIEFEDIISGEGRLNKDVSQKFDDRKGIVFEANNILYGKLRPYLKNWLLPDFKGIALGDFWVFETKNNNPNFIYYLVQADKYQKIANDTSGTKMPRSDWQQVSNTYFAIPTLEEQKKVGRFLIQLDKTIALHQQKLDLLKQSKKSFLQTLFPKKEKPVPNIRFSGFDEEWEQRKLGEVSDIIGGGTPSTTKKEYWGGNIDWYSPVEIGNNTYVSGSHNKITEIGLRKSSAKILPKGSVLFTSRAGIGKTAILAREGATNQGFQSIVPNKNMLDTYFIFSRSSELKRYGEITGAGSTFVEVSGKQMSKMPIFLPSLEEQVKIGLLFKRVDDTITLQEQKIESLQQMKKSFLQKMFV